ncbi:hypothetical protein KIN20_007520, partial [Parelaphostrongylus tenuis]
MHITSFLIDSFLSTVGSIVTFAGFAPIEPYRKRYMILKQLRNSRQMPTIVPRTNSTCNSYKLANVMVR